jgi:hypothetical protein
VWGTTWGCSPAAEANGRERNPKGRPAVLAADSGLHGERRSGGQLASGACVLTRLDIADLLVMTDCSGGYLVRRDDAAKLSSYGGGGALQRAARCAGEEGAGRRRLERAGGLKGDAVLESGAGTARTPRSGGAGLRRVLAAHAMARWAFGGPGDRAWSGLGSWIGPRCGSGLVVCGLRRN